MVVGGPGWAHALVQQHQIELAWHSHHQNVPSKKKEGLMIEHPSSQVPSRPNQTETSYGAQEDAQQVLYLQARLGKAELMKERWS